MLRYPSFHQVITANAVNSWLWLRTLLHPPHTQNFLCFSCNRDIYQVFNNITNNGPGQCKRQTNNRVYHVHCIFVSFWETMADQIRQWRAAIVTWINTVMQYGSRKIKARLLNSSFSPPVPSASLSKGALGGSSPVSSCCLMSLAGGIIP